MDRIPKASKIFCMMKMSILTPRIALSQGIKKKERQPVQQN
ncbi:hypothetical protein BM49_1174 [Streptococcus pneumoniae]|nr:hypothetical protein SPAR52_1726 [Streptococcus pneumoniae GA17971]KGI26377.1 hypothetical protein BM49_1174 [Streptococcus pneumoniae]KGI35839.1 hypothetical protein X231_0522 [Streptococcus pneumoniae ECC_3510]